MIVRILDDAQYEIDSATLDRLNTLDADLTKAIEHGDEAQFDKALSLIVNEVHASGKRLDATTITPSDLTLPHIGATLDELQMLLLDEDATKK